MPDRAARGLARPTRWPNTWIDKPGQNFSGAIPGLPFRIGGAYERGCASVSALNPASRSLWRIYIADVGDDVKFRCKLPGLWAAAGIM